MTTAGPFVIDTTAPTVVSVGSEGGTGDGELNEGENALLALTQLEVTFSEVVDPVGSARDIADPSHYRLVDVGSDRVLDTLDCDGSVAGDDSEIDISSAWAWSSGFTVSLQIGLDRGLEAGSYALIVCGMVDPMGNTQASPWIRRFGVMADNLLFDPSFDSIAAGLWDVSAPNAQDIRFIGQDDSSEASGMVVFDPLGGAGARLVLSQCLEVASGGPYVLGGISLVDSPEESSPTLSATVRYYRNLGCTDPIDTTKVILVSGSTDWRWTTRQFVSTRAPAAALSAVVGFAVEGGSAESYAVYLDETAFLEGVIFVEGFERGDSSWWGAVQGN